MRSSVGISTMASQLSPSILRKVPPSAFLARIAASSSGVGGISGVRSTETSTLPIEHTAPSMNEPNTQ